MSISTPRSHSSFAVSALPCYFSGAVSLFHVFGHPANVPELQCFPGISGTLRATVGGNLTATDLTELKIGGIWDALHECQINLLERSSYCHIGLPYRKDKGEDESVPVAE